MNQKLKKGQLTGAEVGIVLPPEGLPPNALAKTTAPLWTSWTPSARCHHPPPKTCFLYSHVTVQYVLFCPGTSSACFSSLKGMKQREPQIAYDFMEVKLIGYRSNRLTSTHNTHWYSAIWTVTEKKIILHQHMRTRRL